MKILYAGVDPHPITMKTSGDERPAGLHVSDITRRMNFERDRTLNPDTPIEMMTLERGYTWEYVLESALSARHERLGERPAPFQENGIWLSPDWIRRDQEGIQLEEWKATKKSLKKGFEALSWSWLPNTMAYLRGLLRRGDVSDRRIRFRVWHINGDYSYAAQHDDLLLLRDYWIYDTEFTQRELDENWQSILSHGRRYGLIREDGSTTCPDIKPQQHSSPSLNQQLQASLEIRNSHSSPLPNSVPQPDTPPPTSRSRKRRNA